MNNKNSQTFVDFFFYLKNIYLNGIQSTFLARLFEDHFIFIKKMKWREKKTRKIYNNLLKQFWRRIFLFFICVWLNGWLADWLLSWDVELIFLVFKENHIYAQHLYIIYTDRKKVVNVINYAIKKNCKKTCKIHYFVEVCQ